MQQDKAVVFLQRLQGRLRRYRMTGGGPRRLRGWRGGQRLAGSRVRGLIGAGLRGRTDGNCRAAEGGRSNCVIRGPPMGRSKMQVVLGLSGVVSRCGLAVR